MKLRTLTSWGAFGAIALASGLGARPDAAGPTLTGAQRPGGAVRLEWTLAGAHAPRRLQLVRSTSREGLEAPGYPTTRVELPGFRRGAWLDAAPADGVTYHYRLVAETAGGPVASPDFAIATAQRALPALARPELRIDKRAYVLTVVDRGRVAKRYPVALGRSPERRKLHFDNASTPEGVYRIANVQPRATYHRAYDLSYPNALDRVRYRLASAGHAQFPAIGGEIQIHGRGIHANWTYGCIALRDADMDELFGRPAIRVGTAVRIWGGELSESEVEALAAPPPAAALERWKVALNRRGFAAEAAWGPGLWEALGRFQRHEKLPVTCQPDGETLRRLGI